VNSFGIQRACTWSGIVGVSLFFLALICAHFLPPPSPSLDQDAVVAIYQQHTNGILVGMLMMMVSGMFIMPLVGVISAQIKRISGISPALVYAQISAGTVGAVFFFVPALLFIVTAFRPERPAELTYLMNDFCWIGAVLPFPPTFMQNIIIAVSILSDRSPQPIFPRWLAYANIWISIGLLPTLLLPFFKRGPFAWNGILVFWLDATVLGIWFIIMTVTLLKAISREESDHTRSN
jgi:hypothetical protein